MSFPKKKWIELRDPNPLSSLRYLLYTSSGGGGHRSGPRYQGGASTSGGQLFFNQAGKSTPYNATLWLKRLVRDLSRKVDKPQEQPEEEDVGKKEDKQKEEKDEEEHPLSKRDVSLNMDLLDIVGVDSPNAQPLRKRSRTKRQSPGRSTLCQTTSQFITPQAALNSRGNWMFVVNEQNTARQMVKAELCA